MIDSVTEIEARDAQELYESDANDIASLLVLANWAMQELDRKSKRDIDGELIAAINANSRLLVLASISLVVASGIVMATAFLSG